MWADSTHSVGTSAQSHDTNMTIQSGSPTDYETIGRTLVDAAWNDGDLDQIESVFAPEVIIHDPANPTAGTGPEGYKQFVARITDGVTDLELTIDDVIVADGTVVIQTSGTVEGDFPGSDPIGADDETTLSGFEVIHVEDDRIVEWSGTLLDDRSVEAFVGGLSGDVTCPDDANYDEVRAVWNGMIDRYPALIVHCTGVADVIDAVNLAREHDLLVAVRGGGHNVGGSAVCDGGMVIDLSTMTGVRVDLDAQTVRVEGGATWADVDRETQVFGLATPGGNVSITGVAGLTLGGGMGWLRRKYGLSIDNLVSVDVVTADGTVLTANRHENAELFWGVRGGGGNFGVVTSFEYRLHPVGPEVMFAAPMYPHDKARELLPVWRDMVEEMPEEVTAQAVFWSIPAVSDFPEELHGEPIVVFPAMHCGTAEEGNRVLQPLRELAEPLLDLSGVMPYIHIQQMFDPILHEGRLYYWKSLDLDSLDEDVIDAIVTHAEARPSPDTLMPIWHHGGAMNRVGPTETAFGDRSTTFNLSIDATWDEPGNTEENIAWARDVWEDMHRFSDGGLYLNFAGLGEEGEELMRAGHGEEIHERLARLKAEYDPENRFRLNQNIHPTTEEGTR